MENKVRKAFEVANELAAKASKSYAREAFIAVFHAMMAGTYANPSGSGSSDNGPAAGTGTQSQDI